MRVFKRKIKNTSMILMEEAKHGDAEAFGRVYELYFTPVFRYIFLRIKNKEESENITQEVFLKVFKVINRFEERGKSPLNLFFTVARNTLIDFWQKKKDLLIEDLGQNFFELDNLYLDAERNTEIGLLSEEIYKALEMLIGEQKDVIELKFFAGLKTREIAELLNKREEAIRQIQCRALKALKEYFNNNGKK
jgi:RNA polymerase sigma-70 factor (ECF subfamily)